MAVSDRQAERIKRMRRDAEKNSFKQATNLEPNIKDYMPEAYTKGDRLVVKAPTWWANPKFTFQHFIAEYAKNPRQALKDYASEATLELEPYIKDKYLIYNNVNWEREHPLNPDRTFKDWFKPSRHKYFMHLDMSSSRDAAGIAMAHYDDRQDKVFIDLMDRIEVPADGAIELERFRRYVLDIQGLHFPLYKVTFDRWQSLDIRQQLARKKIDTGLYSVDIDTEAYDTMLEFIMTGRLDYYYFEPFIDECKELMLINGKKIDHPVGGSKDVADAVAGVCGQIGLALKAGILKKRAGFVLISSDGTAIRSSMPS